MVYSKKQYRLLIILILIVCFILIAYAQEIQFRRTLYAKDSAIITVPLPITSPRCVVQTRYYYFTVEGCKSLGAALAVTVIGRVERGSDRSIFEPKRLIATDIVAVHKWADSLIDWRLIAGHSLQVVRQQMIGVIQRYLPPYQAGMVLAIVFGTTEWLVTDIKPYFETTGTLHILAASGQNIALLLLLIDPTIPQTASSRLKGLLLLAVAWAYLFVVGLQPSLVRATLMATTMLISRYMLFRQYSALYTLLLSVCVILMIRPEWMMSIGLWLSASATAGIIILYRFIYEIISRVWERMTSLLSSKLLKYDNTISSYIVESLSAGIAAQLATFPILFTQIGSVQALAFIPTMVISWLIPLLMTNTVLLVILGSLTEFLHVPARVVSTLSLIGVWLPTDLFVHALELLAFHHWGVIQNPWLEH